MRHVEADCLRAQDESNPLIVTDVLFLLMDSWDFIFIWQDVSVLNLKIVTEICINPCPKDIFSFLHRSAQCRIKTELKKTHTL